MSKEQQHGVCHPSGEGNGPKAKVLAGDPTTGAGDIFPLKDLRHRAPHETSVVPYPFFLRAILYQILWAARTKNPTEALPMINELCIQGLNPLTKPQHET
jgi:hypothetical protein